jgi:membrane protein YqaA with SNARE-associated domain
MAEMALTCRDCMMHGVGRLFSILYQTVMRWSRHPKATRYLATLSFAESSFFPIPPDVMLAPMCLAQPQRAYWLAFVTTVSSVLGGLLGYLIGLWAMEMALPWFLESRYAPAYELARQWFADYGVWAVLLAGFSPVPYKVFTIAAGAASMAVLPFVVASVVGRGGRFFLVAALMKWGGAPMEQWLGRWVGRLGWILVVLVILGLMGYQLVTGSP